MQHQDRDSLLDAIIAEVRGNVSRGEGESDLRARLNAHLDHFLREAQPIVDRQVSVLIADIRGFTALTETQPMRVMVDLLNHFFSRMVDAVERHQGVVDKFMGDSVMALFGVPYQREDDLLRAIACSIEMQQAMAALNRDSRERQLPSLYAGIAISTGHVMAGSFGSRHYSEYTVIGDPVNLAARIENFSLRGQILLSESSHEAARESIQVGAINQVTIKGKSEPVRIYELKALEKPTRLLVPEVESRKSPRISVDFPVVCRPVVAKRVLTQTFVGKAHDLGYYGISADLPLVLPPCSEVLMSLAPTLENGKTIDVYARVVRTQQGRDAWRTNLEFTTLDTPGHQRVKQFIDHMLWGPLSR